MENLTFLGVVNRDRNIDIPWRGTTIYVEHDYEVGQNLIVTLAIDENTICAPVVKVELPEIKQLKAMKDELTSDWERFSAIFNNSSMGDKVRMLRALDMVKSR